MCVPFHFFLCILSCGFVTVSLNVALALRCHQRVSQLQPQDVSITISFLCVLNGDGVKKALDTVKLLASFSHSHLLIYRTLRWRASRCTSAR